jgi:CopG family transcriptional regulator, nickel-responsive regulator
MAVVRFGVSLEQDLLDSLDKYVTDNRLTNRSQAIRRLIHNNLVEQKWQCNNIVVGSITLVYDHNKNDILKNLAAIQDEYHSSILSSQHFQLDKSHSMDIIAAKGKAILLTEISDKLKALKGIQHGKLTMSKAD